MESSINRNIYPSMRNSKKCSGLTLHDGLELVSNAAIPLMIGVISLWIAIHQGNVAQKNREKDAAQAAEVRKQDLQLARLQREEDNKALHLQREEDQEISRLQRYVDQETARLQRELDLNITNEKRRQDYELAEKERNSSEIQRAKEFKVAYDNHLNDIILEDDRQKENILLEYQDDLAELLLNYGTLVKDPESKWWFILQMKTGAALRQLDPPRRTILVRTLLETGILDVNAEKIRSIFYMANLSEVEFGQSYDTYIDDICVPYTHLHISEADLRYASFYGICIYASFSLPFCDLDHTDWSFSLVTNIHFNDEMTMNGAKFTGARLRGVRFNKAVQMNYVSFQYNTECMHCIFMKTSLLGARLDHSKFIESTFESLSMADGNMTNGSFVGSNFVAVIFNRVDFSGADLKECTFSHVSMINCSMFETKLDQVKFDDVNMTGCKGLTDRQISVMAKLYQTTLPNGTYVNGTKKLN